MKKIDIARAFRDEDYYLSLSEAERASLPAHPAAPLAVSVSDLKVVTGALQTNSDLSCGWSAICTPCPPRQCF
ncbi:MAG TPA: mersacidin/lichenicidin family type 2 lantibiotic [Thermoanaerobaculia bacterium]|nr:mersacidin/lichenicidin family type 2 lantibiotic [Thermoanaerobaculia bacterium]